MDGWYELHAGIEGGVPDDKRGGPSWDHVLRLAWVSGSSLVFLLTEGAHLTKCKMSSRFQSRIRMSSEMDDGMMSWREGCTPAWLEAE